MQYDSDIALPGSRQVIPWNCEGYAIFAIKREYLYLASLLLVSSMMLFYGLGGRVLWDIDEGMHAVMAQNMLLTGDWVTPVFNGEPFYDKPVLFNWLCAISFSLFGFTDFAARLPAAVAGLGCVLLTYLIGRKLYHPMAGILAGLIMVTSLEFAVLSRMVQYDVPFTFFTTLSLYFLCCAIRDTHRRARNMLYFYVAAALAVLTKGPLGLFIPLLALGCYVVVGRRFRLLPDMQFPMGAAIIVAIVVPWYVLMERANPGYLQYFLTNQHLANVIGAVGDASPRHPEPFHYYVPVLFAGLFPWSIMLLQALRRATRSMSVLLLIWIASIFAFFSLADSKLSTYILPAFPAAAVLLARYWYRFLEYPDERTRRGMLFGAAIAFLLLTALAGYTIVADPWIYWEQERGLDWTRVEILAAALAITTGVVLAAL